MFFWKATRIQFGIQKTTVHQTWSNSYVAGANLGPLSSYLIRCAWGHRCSRYVHIYPEYPVIMHH